MPDGADHLIGQHGQVQVCHRIFSQKDCGDILWGMMLKNDPLFNSIMDEPQFRKIQKEVETKYQAEHEKVRKWLEEQSEL